MPTIARKAIIKALILTAIITAAAAGTATAQELELSDQDVDIMWDNLQLIYVGTTTTCDVTLLGTFHEAIVPKVSNFGVGQITHASVNGCSPGTSATVLTETLPWHIRYVSFQGSLPNITQITFQLINVAFRFDPAELPACLFRTEASEPFVGRASIDGTGEITGLAADPNASIDLEDEEFLCAGGDLELGGTGMVLDLDGDLVFITLV